MSAVNGHNEGTPTENHPFLTEDRVQLAGNICAPLLLSDLSWIERRKDAIEILDDTALRRRVSVDFSLRKTVRPLLAATDFGHAPTASSPPHADTPQSPPVDGDAVTDEALFCAPVFVLPKSPANLMDFDLEDEAGRSLRLQSKTDNAKVSAAVIVAMAKEILVGEDLAAELEVELRAVASANAVTGKALADELLNIRRALEESQLQTLRSNKRFRQWLMTFGHSSLCIVLYRAPRHNRKLFRLSFTAPIATEQPWQAMLGWSPYRLVLEVPLLEARTFHFEATSPAGLRVTEAALSDDEAAAPVRDEGLRRRVHLYRPNAQEAGAGSAVLHLVVGGPGFLTGAFLASALTFIALVLCAIFAQNIERSPTSAPSLLLVLPGLIASYVARPDQHALTSRLLSGARYLLLMVAGCAYLAAARVALTGAPDPRATGSGLRLMLGLLAIIAAATIAGLFWTRMRADDPVERCKDWMTRRRRWQTERTVSLANASPSQVRTTFRTAFRDIVPGEYESLLGVSGDDDPIRFVHQRTFGSWFLEYQLAEISTGCRVVGRCTYSARFKRGWGTRRIKRQEALDDSLAQLSERVAAAGTGGAPASPGTTAPFG